MPHPAKAFVAAPLAALLLLGGCSVGDTLGLSSNSSSSAQDRTTGLAVADEPYAARTGAQILSQGGSAADAASAMFFALSVTYPVAAGLGGGGICLVRDAAGQSREFDFLARNAAGGGAFAVPGAVRGIYDMQRVYGSLPWQRDVASAEALAATGFPISEALAQRLAAAQNAVRLDAALAAEFLDQSGQPKPAGAVVTNAALADTLGALRLGGADGFYKGQVGARIATYAAGQGGSISAAELGAYAGVQGAPRVMTVKRLAVTLPGPRTGAGAFVGSMMNELAQQSADAAASAAVSHALARFGVTALPKDLGSTGFAALDANGQAAACVVTLGAPFGSGRTAQGTGVVLAPSPSGDAGLANAFLAPVIAADGDTVKLAGAGAGGPNGAAAMGNALLALAQGKPLGVAGDLRSTGQAPFDTVNVIACQSVCVALADPGAHGAGAAAPVPIPDPGK
jgi:gamma-glutamyltranspeptidase/glutathione hydrolase